MKKNKTFFGFCIITKYIRGNEKKANIAKDRQKKLARLQAEKVVIEKKAKTTRFKFTMDHESGVIPFKIEDLSFQYKENHKVLENINLELMRGEKLLIVGENGVGKSTFLKLLVGHLIPQQGCVQINDKVVIGYYAQEHELLESDKTIIENFTGVGKTTTEIRSLLGNFLFHGDDIEKKINVLSPGERSRVSLAKLTLTGANVLLLDEPTNHLDPETQEIIASTFKEFPGTMIVVSHNPSFVKHLGIEKMLMLPSGILKDYDENIIEYYHQIDIENNKKG